MHRSEIPTTSGRRRGSALVIVLGMLSVLMLMAVAFSVSMRTEQSGATNARNAKVAEQALATAITRAIADIDAHMDGGAAPTWTVLASMPLSGPDNGDIANALTYKASLYLPPDQRAAAMSTNAYWCTIRGGVCETDDDPVLARYAYTVVNTSGLLDANIVGKSYRTKDRTNGVDTSEIHVALQDGESDAFIHNAFKEKGHAEKLDSGRRDSVGHFATLRDFIAASNKTGVSYVYAPDNSAVQSWNRYSTNDFCSNSYSVDSLAPFSSAASEKPTKENPYGIRTPKFYIASQEEVTSASGFNLLRSHMQDAFAEHNKSMKDVFSLNDAQASTYKRAPSGDSIPFSDIAAVALADYIDDDIWPACGSGGSKYPGVSDPTLFPCTEAIPMFTSFEIMGDKLTQTQITPDDGGDPYYKNKITVVLAPAIVMNALELPSNVKGKQFTAVIEVSQFKVTSYSPLLKADTTGDNDTYRPGSGDRLPGSLKTAIPKLCTDLSKEYKFTVTDAAQVFPSKGDLTRFFKADLEFESSLSDYTGDGLCQGGFLVPLQIKATIKGPDGKVLQRLPGDYATGGSKEYGLNINLRIELKNDAHQCLMAYAYCLDNRFAFDCAGGGGDVNSTWFEHLQAQKSKYEKLYPDTLRSFMLEFRKGDGTCGHFRMSSARVANPYQEFVLSGNDTRTYRMYYMQDKKFQRFSDFPDHVWARFNGNKMSIDNSDRARKLALAVHAPNRLPRSVGELGLLPIAPMRTVDLFDERNPASSDTAKVIVRHRVLDYFTLDRPRTPSSGTSEAYKTAVQSRGRVNLNAPTIIVTKANGVLDEIAVPKFPVSEADAKKRADRRNLDPLTAAFAAAPMNEFATDEDQKKHIAWSDAEKLVRAFQQNVIMTRDLPVDPEHPGDKGASNNYTPYDVTNHNESVYNLSVLGRAFDWNATDKRSWGEMLVGNVSDPDWQLSQTAQCDMEREGVIRNTASLLTTREQSFVILVTADAFTHEFGNDEGTRGNALATACAIVEVWRDPEPLRDKDGNIYWISPYEDGAGKASCWSKTRPTGYGALPFRPVYPWFIRYQRQF